MPNRTPSKSPTRPRRSAPTPGAGGRFGRSTTSPSAGGRFGRSNPTSSAGGRFNLSPTASPKKGPANKAKPKTKGKGKGTKGGLGGLLSALPVSKLTKKSSGKSPAAKATPALAVVAAGAGALLGRKQLQKRKEDDFTPVTTAPVSTSTLNDTPPSTGAPRPVDTSSPDAI